MEQSRAQETDFDMDAYVDNLCTAGRIHMEVRNEMESMVKPGAKASEIIKFVETRGRQRVSEQLGLNSVDELTVGMGGLAFPVGFSVNNCVAHWTWNGKKAHDKVLGENDIVKIDFGIQIEGALTDSARTYAFNDKFTPLLRHSREVTNHMIKASGVDSRLSELGKEMEEIITSFEFDMDGRTYKPKSVLDVCGHSIGPFRVHDGKAYPNVNMKAHRETSGVVYKHKIEDGEYYAIEPFLSTGSGRALPRNKERDPCTHYSINYLTPNYQRVGTVQHKSVFDYVHNLFGTLPFTQRWMYEYGKGDLQIADDKFNDPDSMFKKLIRSEVITPHPPIYDVNGSYVSQFEDNVLFLDGKKIVVTHEDF